MRSSVLLASALLAGVPPAGRAEPQSLSLAGEWRFALDRSAEQLGRGGGAPPPPGEGIAREWFKRELPDRIRLPGILEAQGYGDEISTDTPWVLTLGDAWWKIQPSGLRARFSQPGRVEVPFLSQPPRHYLGPAWYQREIEIPARWAGRRVELFLERPHWETRAWLDDRAFPPENSLVAPHVTDLGLVPPGRHRLTLRIDNRRVVAVPGDNEHADDAHSVSDSLGAAWNGVAGRIELRATAPVWIEEAEVYPRLRDCSALVRVRVGNATGMPGSGIVSAGGKSTAVTWDSRGGSAELDVPLGAEGGAWDEFHPRMRQLTVVLRGEGAEDSRRLSFGLREISHRGRDLLLNGRPINLRMTHFGGDFPLTGYPATDGESWKRIIRVCQSFGLNGMRFHSWCPPEAAFAAADELGFYLQPECGMWNPLSPGGAYAAMLEEETARLLRAFGNHPSFILLSPSNEPGGDYTRVTPQWAARWHERDPRRLYAAGTGWNRPEQVMGGAQYAALVRYGGGQLRGISGWFGRDFREAVRTVEIPVLAHEVGQWCAYPDFGVMNSFTGYLRPGNFDIFRQIARDTGVLEYDGPFARASGLFQLACYKEEIEANLRTPGLSGYQLLDLHDYLGQGTALIGVLDSFWQPKGYASPEAFRRFNGATVPLARLVRRVFTTADTLEADVELYHYGDGPIAGATPYWRIVDNRGRVVAGGSWAARDVPIGKKLPLGHVAAGLSRLAAPGAYRLVAGLAGMPVENDWRFWLYPSLPDAAVPADVLITRDWAGAKARLSAGGKVLFLPGAGDLDPSRCPRLESLPVFWNIQMTVRPPRNPAPKFDAMLGLLCQPAHPALAEFPTGINCDWQWTAVFAGARSVNLGGAPRSLQPIVAAIDDWNRAWRLGVIFECRVGSGRLLVSAIDVEDPAAGPGARQLRRSLLDYMGTEAFRPEAALGPAEAEKLWEQRGAPSRVPVRRAFDPDLDDGRSRPDPARTPAPSRR